MVTPVEVLQTLGDLMRGGKIRYFVFSDMPAWYAAKAATLAAAHAVPGPVAMQQNTLKILRLQFRILQHDVGGSLARRQGLENLLHRNPLPPNSRFSRQNA